MRGLANGASCQEVTPGESHERPRAASAPHSASAPPAAGIVGTVAHQGADDFADRASVKYKEGTSSTTRYAWAADTWSSCTRLLRARAAKRGRSRVRITQSCTGVRAHLHGHVVPGLCESARATVHASGKAYTCFTGQSFTHAPLLYVYGPWLGASSRHAHEPRQPTSPQTLTSLHSLRWNRPRIAQRQQGYRLHACACVGTATSGRGVCGVPWAVP